MYGFHLARTKDLESIMAEGLRRDAHGWDAGYVWFWDCLDAALTMLPRWTMSGRLPCVVLKVDLDGVEVLPDPHCADGRNGYWYGQHARVTTQNLEVHRLTVVSVDGE